ncbi:MAG: carbon-nitrogen hydrolase [Planctomycetota bacterium]
MTYRNVKLAVLQMRYVGSRDAMIDHTEAMIKTAAQQGANIIALQEVYSSPYPCQSEDHRNFDYAETLDGPSITRMQSIAKELGVVVIAPFFERRDAGIYHNAAAVIDVDGSVAGLYRKMHIPDDPLYYEKFYFAPGDLGFKPIETKFAKLGVGICWDQWFPEAARLFALAGAEILVYPTAIGWIKSEREEFGAGQHDAWLTSMRAHAIANGVWVAAPNRVGTQGDVDFWGASFVASPRGEVVAQANHEDDWILVAECNLDEIDLVRTHWPFFRDRRIDAYGDLTRRWIDAPP